MASAFTISPPTCSATASASADLPVPVGPTIAIGRVMAARRRRSSRRRTARRDRAPWLTAAWSGRGRDPGQSGQHLVGDPADDACRAAGSAPAASPAASASSSAACVGDRVGVVAAGRGRGEGVRAVGDHEDADRVGRLVDLRAQSATAGQRRVGVVFGGVHPHLCACVGPGLAAHPARDQRAQRQFGGCRRRRRATASTAHVDAVAGERADACRDPAQRRRCRRRRRSTAAAATPAAAKTARRRSASSPAASAASSGTMTGADGMIAMALSTQPR